MCWFMCERTFILHFALYHCRNIQHILLILVMTVRVACDEAAVALQNLTPQVAFTFNLMMSYSQTEGRDKCTVTLWET